MLRILVSGDRYWVDEDAIRQALIIYEPDLVIHGDAKGADRIAEQIAKEMQIPYLGVPAEWRKYGKAAGPKRNEGMLKLGKPNMVLAFHNDIVKSKGTFNMIGLGAAYDVNTRLYSKGRYYAVTQKLIARIDKEQHKRRMSK